MGLVHGIDEDGRPVSDILQAKLQGYNKKLKQATDPTTAIRKPKKSREFVSSSSSSSPTPQRPRSPPAAALGRPPSVSPPQSPGKPPATEEELQADLALSSDDSAKDYFVLVDETPADEQSRRGEPTLPVMSPEEGRKPTRPAKPSTVRSLHKTLTAPMPVRQSTTSMEILKRRRTAVTAEGLARSAADYTKSTKQLSTEIAEHLSLMPPEKKRCQDLLRGMRVAQRHLCRRIRQALPLNAGRAERRQFLKWLESTVREVEGRSSDELE